MIEPQAAPIAATIYVASYDPIDLTPFESVLETALTSEREIAMINIRAYSDTVGTPEENAAQTQAFAEAVADWFIEQGLSSDRLSAQGLGETNLAIETADEVSEALNRRVEIEVIYVG